MASDNVFYRKIADFLVEHGYLDKQVGARETLVQEITSKINEMVPEIILDAISSPNPNWCGKGMTFGELITAALTGPKGADGPLSNYLDEQWMGEGGSGLSAVKTQIDLAIGDDKLASSRFSPLPFSSSMVSASFRPPPCDSWGDFTLFLQKRERYLDYFQNGELILSKESISWYVSNVREYLSKSTNKSTSVYTGVVATFDLCSLNVIIKSDKKLVGEVFIRLEGTCSENSMEIKTYPMKTTEKCTYVCELHNVTFEKSRIFVKSITPISVLSAETY